MTRYPTRRWEPEPPKTEAQILRERWEATIVVLIHLVCRNGCRFSTPGGVEALTAIMRFAKIDMELAEAAEPRAAGLDGDGI